MLYLRWTEALQQYRLRTIFHRHIVIAAAAAAARARVAETVATCGELYAVGLQRRAAVVAAVAGGGGGGTAVAARRGELTAAEVRGVGVGAAGMLEHRRNGVTGSEIQCETIRGGSGYVEGQ